jgi:hypothetical protein
MQHFLSFDETFIYEENSKRGEDFRIDLWKSLQQKANLTNQDIIIYSSSFEEFETIYSEGIIN